MTALADRWWLIILAEFHIPPWDLERLTYDQFQTLVRAAEQRVKEASRG